MTDTKFSEQGTVFRITEVPEGCCLVWGQVVGDDDETYDGELRFVNKSALHDSPPRRKIDSQIVELQETRRRLGVQIGVLRQELKDFETGANDRMAKLKQHESLARLEDFMAGRITHYVESAYGPPKIITLEDTRADEGDGRYNKLKLLTLFGRNNGGLEWGLNCYSDGSGSNTTVIPCTSHNEALKVAGELFAAHERKAMDSSDRTAPQSDWVLRAKEYGISMGANYRRQLQERQDAVRKEKIVKLETQLRELQESGKQND